MDSYADRDRLLRKLGYLTYAAYLNSELWQSIRSRAIDTHGKRCMLCAKTATCIHHAQYDKDTLVGNCLQHLKPLCNWCHLKVEKTKGGRKRTLHETQTHWRMLMKKRLRIKDMCSSERKIHAGWCSSCGFRAFKGSKLCRPCLKASRVTALV